MQSLHEQGGEDKGVFDQVQWTAVTSDGSQCGSSAIVLGKIDVSGSCEKHEETDGQLVRPILEGRAFR